MNASLARDIISKDGIQVDPKRTKSITQIMPPHNNEINAFLFGKINFVTHFVFDFMEIIKPFLGMNNKYDSFPWTKIETMII